MALEARHERSELPRPQNTASIIGSVSLPVNVFCWLGWKQPSSTGPPSTVCSAPWPNRGRGRSPSRRHAASQANAPRHTITRGLSSSSSSAA